MLSITRGIYPTGLIQALLRINFEIFPASLFRKIHSKEKSARLSKFLGQAYRMLPFTGGSEKFRFRERFPQPDCRISFSKNAFGISIEKSGNIISKIFPEKPLEFRPEDFGGISEIKSRIYSPADHP